MNKKEKETLLKMKVGERLYKYTGRTPFSVCLEDSEEKVPLRIFNSLFENQLLKVDDASAFETWYTLTDKGRSTVKRLWEEPKTQTLK